MTSDRRGCHCEGAKQPWQSGHADHAEIATVTLFPRNDKLDNLITLCAITRLQRSSTRYRNAPPVFIEAFDAHFATLDWQKTFDATWPFHDFDGIVAR